MSIPASTATVTAVAVSAAEPAVQGPLKAGAFSHWALLVSLAVPVWGLRNRKLVKVKGRVLR